MGAVRGRGQGPVRPSVAGLSLGRPGLPPNVSPSACGNLTRRTGSTGAGGSPTPLRVLLAVPWPASAADTIRLEVGTQRGERAGIRAPDAVLGQARVDVEGSRAWKVEERRYFDRQLLATCRSRGRPHRGPVFADSLAAITSPHGRAA